MAKRKNWVSYEQAQRIAVEAGVKSRGQFMKWHTDKGIKDIPKQPNRVYAEWDGWPAFLETGNVFNADADAREQQYMPYWEAVRWTQVFCSERDITTGQGWKQAYQIDRESGKNEIPKEIPKHPENFYGDEWTGWSAWLGKHIRSKIIAQQQEVSLICVAASSWSPPNVLTILMAKDGEWQLLEQLQNRALTPVRIFKFEEQYAAQIKEILQSAGKLQPTGSWIVHNVHFLLSELAYILEIHTVVDREGFAQLGQAIKAATDPNPADGFEELEDTKYTLKVGENSFI